MYIIANVNWGIQKFKVSFDNFKHLYLFDNIVLEYVYLIYFQQVLQL